VGARAGGGLATLKESNVKEFQTIVHQGTATASGASAAGGASTHEGYESKLVSLGARVFLDVTAASGTTPTLAVTLHEVFADGVERQIAAFAQKTAVGQESIVVSEYARRIRARWTIGGTSPSFTFSVRTVRL
jgi:hypothetical protein